MAGGFHWETRVFFFLGGVRVWPGRGLGGSREKLKRKGWKKKRGGT